MLFVVVNIISVSKQNLAVSCVVTYICVLYLVLKSIILMYMFFEFFTQDENEICMFNICLFVRAVCGFFPHYNNKVFSMKVDTFKI